MNQKQLVNESEARMKRGLVLLENNGKSITENADGSFVVPSQTSDKTYEVRLLGDRFVCTCPDFEYREIDACKHIHAVKLWIAVRTQLQNEPQPRSLLKILSHTIDADLFKLCVMVSVVKSRSIIARIVTANSENPIYSGRL
jgi:hypothetical protein